MRVRSHLPLFLALLPLHGLFACSEADGESCMTEDPVTMVAVVGDAQADGVVEIESETPNRPHLRYRDGQASQLTHCAIKLANKLNPKIPPCYVNGSPVGFC